MSSTLTAKRRVRISRPLAPAALSLAYAAHVMGIGLTKLNELVSSGDLPTVTIGRRRLVLMDDLNAYLAALRKRQANRIGLPLQSTAPSTHEQ